MGYRQYLTPSSKASASASGPEHGLEGKQVLGTSRLFKDDQLQYIPMPSPDPKDPLNLPEWRKWLAICALCFFGSLASSIENVIGHLIPLFFLEYNGYDSEKVLDLPALHRETHNGTEVSQVNALAALTMLENGTSLSQVTLLSTLPLVVNGVALFFLIPLSTAIGRRPVMLLAGLLAWVGGFWAGQSGGLTNHLAARCFQGFGAGAVDALIPLVLQDLMFIHQRNKVMATLNTSTGVIMICLGIACPVIALRLGWRTLYTILSCLTATSWISIIFCVPETRVNRSKDELAGKHVYSLYPGEARPRLDFKVYSARTPWVDFGVFNVPILWKLGARSFFETFRCLSFLAVPWAVLLTSIMAGAGGAMSQSAATVLLAAGWKFEHLGLAGLALIVAAPFAWLFSGYMADRVCNHLAKRRGGHREPEHNLINVICPVAVGIIGVCVFGYAAANIAKLSSAVLLLAVFFFVFSSSCVNTTIPVFLVESYPDFAGPVLVAFSSLRLIIGFGFTIKATEWIEALGFMRLFGIYAGLIVFASLLGILIWIYGKQIRAWSAGTVETGIEADSSNPTETVPKEVQTSDSQASVGCGGLIEGIQMSSISKSPYAIRKSRH